MHDTDSFARMPALDSRTEQPPIAELLLSFEKECEISFKEEVYLVRDNGAVLRRARPQARRRKLDEAWTFGTLDRHSGYLKINGQVVHRIVATAFHGPQPSPDHVVDHIDTNRQNNRADNLRWVTRLENILLNPITRRRIELAYGSIEAFFENPGAGQIPNWDWMKTVSKEEAQRSRKRLLEWAEKGQAGRGGTIGDWLYRHAPQVAVSPEPKVLDAPSLSIGATQHRWRTPTKFPHCPETMSADALNAYHESLSKGAVFARNRYGESIVEDAAIGPDGALSVVCNMPTGVKDWTHARVFAEAAVFRHEAGGTFFTLEGAMKAHCKAIGASSDAYEGSIDDFC